MRHVKATVFGILAATVLVAASVSFSGPTWAAEPMFPKAEVVDLKNGITTINLNGDGRKLVVVKYRNDFSSPHNKSYYHFLVEVSEPHYAQPTWTIAPIKSTHDRLQGWDTVSTHEGADCVLRDVRLLIEKVLRRPRVTLIVGNRDFEGTYVDEEKVRFVVYRLKQRKEEDLIPGYHRYYFESERIIESKSKHCDINQAFLKELGIEYSANFRQHTEQFKEQGETELCQSLIVQRTGAIFRLPTRTTKEIVSSSRAANAPGATTTLETL